ncbi:MAG: RNA polymerase sigma factor [Oscillospiraceae bacterium]|nr:RNA polymerase sigma factor [Oscillospiraceae bacterium]
MQSHDENYTNSQITEIYNRNYKSVYRVCFMYMKNKADTEDMLQNTFLRLISSGTLFENPEHEKAWLIRAAVNLCKNSLKSFWNNKTVAFDEGIDSSGKYEFIPEPDQTLQKVMALPPKLKTTLYLYYYEGYSSEDIAKIMGKPSATIRGYLHRGRGALRKQLETEAFCNGM